MRTAHSSPLARHDSADIERIFAQCFEVSDRTLLKGGAAEPLYEPSVGEQGMNLLWYREDFFASALHESAHWCIAGAERRKQRDFGYWYAPEGRDPDAQRAFEAVEAAPQALEWLFSVAARYPFRLSADNVESQSGQVLDNTAFADAVHRRAIAWQSGGLGARAARFFDALASFYGWPGGLVGVRLLRESLR
ncbi:MAG: elongation factor P hydroxylase [Pseudomonadota bacterium]